MISVVCGIIYNEDKIFICRRKAHKSLAGFWEFPGGKVESGEILEDALKRELLEELGMEVIVKHHFKTVVHKYPDFTIKLIAFKCEFLNATYKMTDHDMYKWIDTNSLLLKELAPADIPIANSLQRL